MLSVAHSQPCSKHGYRPLSDKPKLWWLTNWKVISETDTTFKLRCDMIYTAIIEGVKGKYIWKDCEIDLPITDKEQILALLPQIPS